MIQFIEFYVTVQTAGKLVRKRTLNLLIRPSLHQFSHRMNIRCFLTGFFGQEDEPSALLQFYGRMGRRNRLRNGFSSVIMKKEF